MAQSKLNSDYTIFSMSSRTDELEFHHFFSALALSCLIKDEFISIFSVGDINKSSFLHPGIYFHKTCMNFISLRPQLL